MDHSEKYSREALPYGAVMLSARGLACEEKPG
jgi:hypothetical protein